MTELYELLKKIEVKLNNVEENLEKISGEFTEMERENMELRKTIDELIDKSNLSNEKDLI